MIQQRARHQIKSCEMKNDHERPRDGRSAGTRRKDEQPRQPNFSGIISEHENRCPNPKVQGRSRSLAWPHSSNPISPQILPKKILQQVTAALATGHCIVANHTTSSHIHGQQTYTTIAYLLQLTWSQELGYLVEMVSKNHRLVRDDRGLTGQTHR